MNEDNDDNRVAYRALEETFYDMYQNEQQDNQERYEE